MLHGLPVAVKEAASLRKHACSSALCFGVISGETGAGTRDMLQFPTITCLPSSRPMEAVCAPDER